MKNFENILQESAYQQAVSEAAATSSKKFDKLLRLGLVSRDNLTKARRVFRDPDRFGTTSNSELRQLVMDILQDIISNVIDDPRIYNLIYTAYLGDAEDVDENVDEFAKFTQLAKAGLIDRTVLTKTLRILRNPTKVTAVEYKTVVMSLLMNLLDRVVGDPTTFSAVRRSLAHGQAHEDVAEDVANTASAPGLAMVSDGEPVLVKKKRKGKKCCG